MYPHHHEAIDILASTLKHDPDVRALIIGGSLAKGWGSENSDIDCYIVVTAERFAAQLQARQLSYFNNTICSYPGGYIDGKYVDEAWLRACAERSSEPAHLVLARLAGILAHPQFRRVDQPDSRLPIA